MQNNFLAQHEKLHRPSSAVALTPQGKQEEIQFFFHHQANLDLPAEVTGGVSECLARNKPAETYRGKK